MVVSLVGIAIALVAGVIGATIGHALLEEVNGRNEPLLNIGSILGFVGAATGAFTVYEKLVGEDSIF